MKFKNVAMLIMLIFIVLANYNESYTQNETGKRAVYKTAVQTVKNWYDSSLSMYQVQYPIIRSIPPLSTDMPLDILIGYIYLDSLLRFTTLKQTELLIKSWTTLNDTLTYTIQYLYKLVDYDPMIFTQYSYEVARYHKRETGSSRLARSRSGIIFPNDSSIDLPGRYTNYLYNLAPQINNEFYKLIPNESEKRALYSLVGAEYILKVRVLYVDSMLSKYPNFTNNMYYNVTAEVLDTIKGKKFKTVNYQELITSHDFGNLFPAGLNPLIQFDYVTQSYWIAGEVCNNGMIYENPDSAFLKNKRYNMSPGQQCVVFLEHDNRLMDSSYDYFELGVAPRYSLNALPIINGQVRDVNHVWSQDLYMNYEEWRTLVNSYINKILSRAY